MFSLLLLITPVVSCFHHKYEGCDTITNREVDTRQSYDTAPTGSCLIVMHSVFHGCTCEGFSNGGAINIASTTSYLIMSQNQFYECSSRNRNGGAIYYDVLNSTIISACFWNCYAYQGVFIFGDTKEEESHVFNMSTGTDNHDRGYDLSMDCFHLVNGNQHISSINSSNIQLSNANPSYNVMPCEMEMKYCLIDTNTGYSILTFNQESILTKYHRSVHHLNIINNTCSRNAVIMFMLPSLEITDCIIQKNTGFTTYIGMNSNPKISGCIFDKYSDYHNETLPDGNKIAKADPYTLSLFNTAECGNNIFPEPTATPGSGDDSDDSDNSSSIATIVGSVIGVIVIGSVIGVGGYVFFTRRNQIDERSSNTKLLETDQTLYTPND